MRLPRRVSRWRGLCGLVADKRAVEWLFMLSAALFALSFATAMARAEGAAPEATFKQGVEAIHRGEYGTAIDAFEALADQGFQHPDASFDRGVAYAMRYRARGDHPGDLGRAAAAFEEALRLRPGDREADAALDLVRAEVTRRRARQGKSAVVARPTLDRAVVGLASEASWGILAILSSVAFSVGLVLRGRTGRRHVVGSILTPTAAAALLLFCALTLAARSLRLTTRPGVVITSETALCDDLGKPMAGDPVPEAAAVEVHDRRGAMLQVQWGATKGWVRATDIRVLERWD